MDIFTILLGAVVITASAVMVAMPLVRGGEENLNYKNPGVDMEENLAKNKEDTFAILNEIEFDYKTRKLAEEDYQLLKNKYQKQAVAILKEEEEISGRVFNSSQLKELEQQVEDEIAKELEQLLKQQKK
ncbi:MAG: hypothetical protein KGZ96_01625 [Clostridia bacterium]|jgi:hypothetical protein|nr:hypothetical protein [Clostridia bacterium]